MRRSPRCRHSPAPRPARYSCMHSMHSYKLCECVVMVQQRFGVACSTHRQVVKVRAVRALAVLVLDDAKHREPHPSRRRMPSSAARTTQ